MQWLWTWGGTSFGYRERDDLRTHDGRHVGRFHGDEVYAPDGRYLGELMHRDRLITSNQKKHLRRGSFSPYASYAGYARYANYAGYEDFPAPEDL